MQVILGRTFQCAPYFMAQISPPDICEISGVCGARIRRADFKEKIYPGRMGQKWQSAILHNNLVLSPWQHTKHKHCYRHAKTRFVTLAGEVLFGPCIVGFHGSYFSVYG